MPSVSIVLPTYNGEKYIRQSIDSIIKQTYLDWELIIVDDCSKDDTPQIVANYCNQDSRIKVIRNSMNQKLPQSLNIGFAQAYGKYLTWTSDDNLYEINALDKMVKYLEQCPECGMVYADMKHIDMNGNCIGHLHSQARDMYLYNCIGACFMYRSECMENIGKYDTERFLVEDYDYWIRISQKYVIHHLDEELYQYRFHDNSLTSTRMIDVGKQVLRLKVDYLDYLMSQIDLIEQLVLLFEICVYDHEIAQKLCIKFKGEQYEKEIQWILKKRKFNSTNKLLLFGAGVIGMSALKILGEDRIYGFIDNNVQKIGTYIKGKKVFSINEGKKICDGYSIVVATDVRKAYFIAKQLEELEIYNYKILYEIL